MVFGFTVLSLFLFGVALHFAYLRVQSQFAAQLKTFRQQAFKKQSTMRREIKAMDTKLIDTMATVRQLAMSHPTKIDLPQNPLARAEQRVINEAAKKFKVV